MILFLLAACAGLALALLYSGRGYWAWTGAGALLLIAWGAGGTAAPFLFGTTASLFAILALVFGVPQLRRHLFSRFLMRRVGPFLPRIGPTERIALDAGTVWWDREVFSGNPDWSGLLDFRVGELTGRERAFLDGPVEELCAMLDDWKISAEGDLPPEVWAFLKRNRFFGMIIPEAHGGLG
ncbi:MAG: acyl-CoA dehydrogenase, partial [Acidobacteria bacterium]|nr:acyl-CoA dehydrogenase [Acidobacteriota bacterium]